MANFISQDLISQIPNLLKSGFGTRQIAKKLSICKNTAKSYRKIFLENEVIWCACGNEAGHQGWCSERFNRSDARQKFMANWTPNRFGILHRGRNLVPPTLNYPFYQDGSNFPPYYIAILKAVPKNMSEDIRGEICQNMVVAYLAGEIVEDDFPKVVPIFRKKSYENFKSSKFTHISLETPMRGTKNFSIGDTLTSDTFRY